MKTALIIGATGLTGKKLTRLLLADKRYGHIKLLVRKPMDIIYENLEQVVFDFDKPDASMLYADEVFCCLGTTIRKARSKEAFRKVDYEYIVKIATLCSENGVKKFGLISSMGANKNSSIFYNKVKGETEAALKNIGFDHYFIFRPSLLTGHRQEMRLGESIAKVLLNSFSFLLPKRYKPIHCKKVAAAMVYVMNTKNASFQVFESDEMMDMPLIV